MTRKPMHLLWLFLPALCQAGEQEIARIESDHGLSLAISGMVIVFGGLIAISGFIALLPRALCCLRKPNELRPPPKPMSTVEGLDPQTLMAIALAIHAEAERTAGQGLKVTLPLNASPWGLSNQMRVLPGRISS
jgi:hypothetical protein